MAELLADECHAMLSQSHLQFAHEGHICESIAAINIYLCSALAIILLLQILIFPTENILN